MIFQDKVIIVTGASSGIGAAASHLLAREGARLVLSARRKDRLDLVSDEIRDRGGTAVTVRGDVGEEHHARDLVATAVDTFGGLDAAFNNAGTTGDMAPVADLSAENWETVLRTNLTSAFFLAKYQLPALVARGAGSLVFTSSFVGHATGFPGMGAYAAAKAGLVGLARTIAVEYGPSGIRANALLPGGTETDMAPQDAEARDFIRGLHVLKRMARSDEIANAALFLLSDRASFVTGSAFVADGGNSISKT